MAYVNSYTRRIKTPTGTKQVHVKGHSVNRKAKSGSGSEGDGASLLLLLAVIALFLVAAIVTALVVGPVAFIAAFEKVHHVAVILVLCTIIYGSLAYHICNLARKRQKITSINSLVTLILYGVVDLVIAVNYFVITSHYPSDNGVLKYFANLFNGHMLGPTGHTLGHSQLGNALHVVLWVWIGYSLLGGFTTAIAFTKRKQDLREVDALLEKAGRKIADCCEKDSVGNFDTEKEVISKLLEEASLKAVKTYRMLTDWDLKFVKNKELATKISESGISPEEFVQHSISEARNALEEALKEPTLEQSKRETINRFNLLFGTDPAMTHMRRIGKIDTVLQ